MTAAPARTLPAGGAEARSREPLPVYREVLVPTDFSAVANRAIAVAYGMLPRGGVVHLLHVVTGKPRRGAPDPGERLRALIPPAAADEGISTSIVVERETRPHTGILRAAARLGVDAICMATHGPGSQRREAIGVQALEVVKRARQPVLLVPPERR